jgi:hypothetical protein
MTLTFVLVALALIALLWALCRAPDSRSYTLEVRGVYHENRDGSSRQRILSRTDVGDHVYMIAEPDNPVNPNAIAIRRRRDGKQLGYVRREYARAALAMIQGDLISDALIDNKFSFRWHGRRYTGATVKIYPPPAQMPATPAAVQVQTMIASAEAHLAARRTDLEVKRDHPAANAAGRAVGWLRQPWKNPQTVR